MSTIRIDIVDGSTGRYTAEGWRDVTRIATVSGITGEGQEIIFNAVEALIADSRCGPVNTPHPKKSSVQVVEFIPRAIGPVVVEVTIRYGVLAEEAPSSTSAGARIRFSGRLRSVQTNLDSAGQVVWVEYTYPTDPADANYPHHNTTLAGRTVRRSPLRTVLKPEAVLTVMRRESTASENQIDTYVGCANQAGGPLGAAPIATWLCTAIEVDGPRNGPYEKSYEFQRNRDGWNNNVVVFEREDGVIPSDVTPKQVDDYPLADFTALHL